VVDPAAYHCQGDFVLTPSFLQLLLIQIRTDESGISSSRADNVTLDDVDRNARNSELVYDGVLEFFSRRGLAEVVRHVIQRTLSHRFLG